MEENLLMVVGERRLANMNIAEILNQLGNYKEGGNGYLANCPAHDDKHESLSVAESDDGKILLHCHAGCAVESVVNKLGISMSDLFIVNKAGKLKKKNPIIKVYDYTDESGKLIFQSCRKEDKSFLMRRPGENEEYIYNTKDIKLFPYKLPELVKAVSEGETIFIVEGEKDVDNLAQIGITATTNPMGAGKWKKHYSDYLANANVIVLPDNDEAGKKHAEEVANAVSSIAESIKILQLPNLPEKGDVSDWIKNGGTSDKLFSLALDTPYWEAEKNSEKENSKKLGPKSKNEPSQADILVEIGKENTTLFHDLLKEPYARININGHQETHGVKSTFVSLWLKHKYHTLYNKTPKNEAVNQALSNLVAEAIFNGDQYDLKLRVAEYDGAIYYDLGDKSWRAIKTTTDGWTVEDFPPILFVRYTNTDSQVKPVEGGDIELLKRYINLKNEQEWILLYAYLIASLIPGIPIPMPIIYGDKGSAKTTTQKLLRKLIDPAKIEATSLTNSKDDLVLCLHKNYIPCFDNLDKLNPWQSDLLCHAVTGGGFSKRALYTNTDEVILHLQRSPILNGINNVALRDDLLDRSILFNLQRIAPTSRKIEATYWKEFEEDKPKILGAMFDALVKAMSIYHSIKLECTPRMADFAKWGVAITEAIGHEGNKFIEAYNSNISGAVEEAVQADQVASAVVTFMKTRKEWEGTVSDLLGLLSNLTGINSRSKDWPKNAHALGRQLNKAKSSLMDVGILVERYRDKDARYTRLFKAEQENVTNVTNVI